jgi:hypothetical protein
MGITEPTREQGERTRRLIHSRVQEAYTLPSGAVWSGAEQHNPAHVTEVVALWGTRDIVALQRTTGNYYKVYFGTLDHTLYELDMVGSKEGPRVKFAGSPVECPSLEQQIGKLETLPIGPSEGVPFGWVDGNVVTAIIYLDAMSELRVGTSTYRNGGVSCYVLKGYELPTQLRTSYSGAQYANNLWELVRQGKLIRLTTRIRAMGETVRCAFDGTSLPSLSFGREPYWQGPNLVVNVPYVAWAVSNDVQGETFDPQAHNGGTPYDKSLVGWFH